VDDFAPDFETRLDRFIDVVGDGLRSDTQRAAFGRYAVGLLSDAERKSIEPLAARSRPDAPRAEHHALHYFVAEAPWSDRRVRRAAAAWGLWAATAAGPVRASIIDDTGFLKQGTHSVGVQRQYTGSAGKITNCQIGVSLLAATDYDAVPLDMALYLPASWADDPVRRAEAHVPTDVAFAPKWQLACDLLRAAHADRVPLGEVVLADADYGRVTEFRATIRDLGLHYGVAVPGSQRVWHKGREWTATELAASLHWVEWTRIAWRAGDRPLSARFAFRRVRASATPGGAAADGADQWLILEWRDGEATPRWFHLSSRPRAWSHRALVGEIKRRWQTERFYQDAKGELGLDHFEGRSWIGWHHHVSMVFCCYALLVGERLMAFPPSALAALRARFYTRAA
jgi:SRSO17 transposase